MVDVKTIISGPYHTDFSEFSGILNDGDLPGVDVVSSNDGVTTYDPLRVDGGEVLGWGALDFGFTEAGLPELVEAWQEFSTYDLYETFITDGSEEQYETILEAFGEAATRSLVLGIGAIKVTDMTTTISVGENSIFYLAQIFNETSVEGISVVCDTEEVLEEFPNISFQGGFSLESIESSPIVAPREVQLIFQQNTKLEVTGLLTGSSLDPIPNKSLIQLWNKSDPVGEDLGIATVKEVSWTYELIVPDVPDPPTPSSQKPMVRMYPIY